MASESGPYRRKSPDSLRAQVVNAGAAPLMSREWEYADWLCDEKELKERFPDEWEVYLKLLRLKPDNPEYKNLQEKMERESPFLIESQRAVFFSMEAD